MILSSRNHHLSSRSGFGLIEVVVVTAIVIVVLGAFLESGALSIRLLRTQKESLAATMLAQEGMEAVRAVRDESWTANITPLVDGAAYYPVVINNKWVITANNPGLQNNLYTRSIVFGQVSRDGQDNIASSGTVDADTRKVTVTVAWGSKQEQIEAYITNFQEQLSLPAESKVISYESAITDTDIISFPSASLGDGDPAQSFTTASAVNVTRVDALLRRTTDTPSDIFAEIRTSPLGTVLGTSHIINASTIATSSSAWVEFRFSPEVSLAASTNYYIRLRSSPSSTISGSGSKGSLNWIHLQTASSPYSGGVARRYIEKLGPADTGEQLDQYDFGFKVYALQ
ncbi:MAG: hypothetical protein U1A25_03055 [Candidatus Sungbacteria bacterium]|nr:hypothetical protein [bacterium]MDZ4260621.1 hypothetical protein [Candidatus Sungbacteria bacterium]